jgi:acyl carrier protein
MCVHQAPSTTPGVLEEVRRIVAEELHVEPSEVTPETDLVKDLGASSISVVTLVVKLEARFKIEVAAEDLKNLVVVKDAVAFIERRVSERALDADAHLRHTVTRER